MKLRRMTKTTDDPVLSNTTVDGRRLTWKELAIERQRDIGKLIAWLVICSDLDRCEHGRHEGDVCDGCKGSSMGNPLLLDTRRIGYDIEGRLIRVPERAQRGDPAAWKEPKK